MPVHLPPTADEQPEVTLTHWAAFEAKAVELDGPTIHVVGYAPALGAARVTSPVAKVDAGAVVTSTGRVYRLDGLPGLTGDGQYVWRTWLRHWQATVLSDATQAVAAGIAARREHDA